MQEHEKIFLKNFTKKNDIYINKILISFVEKLITKIKGPPDLLRFYSMLIKQILTSLTCR